MNSQIDAQGSQQQPHLFRVTAPVLAHKAEITNFINIPQSKGHKHEVSLRFPMDQMLRVWREIERGSQHPIHPEI